MRFSDWQLSRIRHALRAYYRYSRDSRGMYGGWADVAGAITAHTDVDIPTERLRQFVEGLNIKKTGERRFPVPRSKSLEAIAKFVTDEKLKLLSKSELKEFSPALQGPLRLLEYLGTESDTGQDAATRKLEGRFTHSVIDREIFAFVVRELIIQRSTEGGLLEVVETEEHYDFTRMSDIEKLSPFERDKICNKRGICRGWAILTPEDNLFFFLKHDVRSKNRYYFTVALNLWRWSESPVTILGLLYHDFPIELEEDSTAVNILTVIKKTKEETANNVLLFAREEGTEIKFTKTDAEIAGEGTKL